MHAQPFCHLCGKRGQVGFNLVPCYYNLSSTICSRSVCIECFERAGWDFQSALEANTSRKDAIWYCPHCDGLRQGANALCRACHVRPIDVPVRGSEVGVGGINYIVDGVGSAIVEAIPIAEAEEITTPRPSPQSDEIEPLPCDRPPFHLQYTHTVHT
eukprot:c6938_g1_i3.p1 GENE.c6938_g1_i3~~c6938_g1_i3.p1  ORF type:complete len:157 (-),score=23.10 c6938_g1_i3:55-525(-)